MGDISKTDNSSNAAESKTSAHQVRPRSKSLFPVKVNKSVLIPKIKHPPKVDGSLNDPVWKKAAKITNFTQFDIHEGKPATEKTVIHVAYDDKNLYFGIRCFDREPRKIRANLSNRDEIDDDDWIKINLDPFNSKQRSFVFGVNPYGIQMDGLLDADNDLDQSWDAIFKSKGKIDNKGWSAEIVIPFKSLRFPRKRIQDWGLLISRYISRKNEKSSWPPITRKILGHMQQAGKIKGIKITPKHTIELTPYIAGGYQAELNPNGKLKGRKHFDIGFDFKYGLRSNLILDLAFNPDFSQVEADANQIEINRRYELYFPEKRPFFLEGMDKFKTPIEVFYSRRIENPLLGAKLTGKFDRYNFGFLSAWDERPNGDPDAFFTIMRMQADLGPQSNFGFIFTDKEYKGEGSHLFNRLFGLDTRLRFLKYYTLTLQGINSWTNQEIPYSRYDNQSIYYYKYNISAPAFFAKFQRYDGSLNTTLSYSDISPEFNAEAGYIQRTDIRNLEGTVEYTSRPETVLRSWSVYAYQQAILNYANELTDRASSLGLKFDFKAKTFLQLQYTFMIENWRDVDYQKNIFILLLTNNLSKFFSGTILLKMEDAIYYDMDNLSNPIDEDNSFLGWRYYLILRAGIKPLRNLSISLAADWENFRENRKGKEVYNIWLLRGMLNYQITSKLFLRSIVQGDTFGKTLNLNALFGYVPYAGTVFYLGYNEDLQLGNKTISTGRTIFSKFAYHCQI